MNKSSEVKKYGEVSSTPLINLKDIFINNIAPYNTKNPTNEFILPENNSDDKIINEVMQHDIFFNSSIKLVHFQNQQAMTDYFNDNRNFLLATVIFESDNYLHYTVRINNTWTPDSKLEPIMDYAKGRYFDDQTGIAEGDKYEYLFSPIQVAVDQAIIRLKTNDQTLKMDYSFGKLVKSSTEYNENNSSGIVGSYVAMMFLLCVLLIL